MDSKIQPRQWIELIDESVHTSDDIGDIEAVNKSLIVVKRGFINIHFYYIPISKVEGWDSHVLWLKVTEQSVKKIMTPTLPYPSSSYKIIN